MKHYDDLIECLRKGTGLPVLQALMNEAADAIQSLTAADVREVERGKWEDDGYGWVRCSICRGAIAVARGGNRFNYCPNCGARMVNDDV